MIFKDRILNEYLPKIFGYAVNRTSTLQDAEDLAQDIITALLRSLVRNSEPENPDTWVWKIAGNVYINKIRRDSYRRFIYGISEYTPDTNIRPDEQAEIDDYINLLRRELSFLTKTRRQITVMYYLENITIAEIASKMCLPIGTVKWHLYSARNEIKKGMDKMRTYGQKSYNPENLILGISGRMGMNGEPFNLVSRMLPVNILLAAYEKPLTIDELCTELGISAPYMENEVELLVNGELLVKQNGKYATDFPIGDTKTLNQIKELALANAGNYCNILIEGVKKLLPEFRKIEFWGNDLTDNQLMWLFVPLTHLTCQKWDKKGILPDFNDYPERPNGGKWYAKGTSYNKYDNPIDSNDKLFINGPLYDCDKGFKTWMLDTYYSSNRLNDPTNNGKKSNTVFGKIQSMAVLPLKIKYSEYNDLSTNDIELLTKAIDLGVYTKRDGYFVRLVPTFSTQQIKDEKKICEKLEPSIASANLEMLEKISQITKNIIPERLDIQKKLYDISNLTFILPAALQYAVEHGILQEPDDLTKSWMTCYIEII